MAPVPLFCNNITMSVFAETKQNVFGSKAYNASGMTSLFNVTNNTLFFLMAYFFKFSRHVFSIWIEKSRQKYSSLWNNL